MTLGHRPAPSNSFAIPLPPAGSLLCLHHHPHGVPLVHRGSAPGCHRLPPHRHVPHDGHNGCFRGKPPHPQDDVLPGMEGGLP